MWLTLSFNVIALQMVIFNLLTYFEDYVPGFLLRTVRFGRSGIGIESKPLLFEVPKGWFTHFYIFASSFITTTLYAYFYSQVFLKDVFTFLLGSPVCIPSETALLALLLFTIQIYRRLYECVFISKFSDAAKMNVTIYFIGFWHYFGAIVSIFGGSGRCAELNPFYACAAVSLFAFAWFKQFEAHKILASLRSSPTDKSYSIPKGGLFEYVSCANYFAELLIYLSLVLLFGFKNYELNYIAIWVLCNQTYSAAMSHQWYLKKFGNKYPTERKRLIPFVF